MLLFFNYAWSGKNIGTIQIKCINYFLVLGGSSRYSEHAEKIKLSNFYQLPYESGAIGVSIFLNTLDIYAHARADGETLGRVIQEAMMHKLPVVSHRAQWNAHVDILGPGGRVVNTEKEYFDVLHAWANRLEDARQYGLRGYAYALKQYSFPPILNKFESIIQECYYKYCLDPIDKNPNSQPICKINYLFLFRYYGIKYTNALLKMLMGNRGSAILLFMQQKFNKTKNFLRSIYNN